MATSGVTRVVRMIGLLCALGGASCSIERSRQAGDDCLQDRECAKGLRCEITATGLARCVAPLRVDAAVPPVVDAGPPVTDAGQDTGAQDVTSPAMDSVSDRGAVPPGDALGDAPGDAPRDVPRDVVDVADASTDGEVVEGDATPPDDAT